MSTTLLLADDSVTIQRVIALTFANEAIRVVTVADGHAATAQLEAERPDIVLADVGLPSVDGYALTELVKRSPRTAGVPVLLLTGAFEPIDEGRARQCGCDGVLVKPFEPQRLVSMVKELLA
ncbi:MAG: response regulator, partial [Acidobacteria bacterium]|nr:response regulator [Acidobacteriota bacterium]